jgi:hypothetical protein
MKDYPFIVIKGFIQIINLILTLVAAVISYFISYLLFSSNFISLLVALAVFYYVNKAFILVTTGKYNLR